MAPAAAKVADEQITTYNAIQKFRKQSVDMGGTVNVEDLKVLAANLQGVSDFESFVDAFIDVVKGCKGNLDNAVKEFCDGALGEEDKVAREILTAMAPKIKPALKMARVGLGARVLLSLVLTYSDLTTDFLVLKEYGEGGRRRGIISIVAVGY